jgi:hypothetical protein
MIKQNGKFKMTDQIFKVKMKNQICKLKIYLNP